MRLFPQNLRDRQHAEIIRRRSYGLQGKGNTSGYDLSATPLPAPKIGPLGRLWQQKSGLTEKQAATGLPAASMTTQSAAWLGTTFIGGLGLLALGAYSIKHGIPPTVWAGFTASTSLITLLSAIPGAGAAFRSLYKRPLGVAEIDHLLSDAAPTFEWEKDYLSLVRDAVQTNAEVTPETEADLQSAITALGEAIDRLPVMSVTPLDTAALRQEADSVIAEAQTQSDPVIAESMERRADALRRRADANERSALSVRRTIALQAEIQAQIAALREGIASLATGYGPADTAAAGNLAYLSESARRVAAEAVSAAAARAELEGGRSTNVPAEPVAEPLRVGAR